MKLKTNELVICSLFASLTAILTQVSIPLPAVPITMQIFAVTLCGLVLGKRLGFISQTIYVLLGTIGLPLFSKFSGGVGIILGPTGGFILSFPIVAFVVGYFYEKFKSTIGIMFGMMCSLLISYIIGTVQFCIVTNSDFIKGLTICVVPFIIVDIIKLSLSTLVGKSILRRVNLKYSIKTS